MEVGSSPLNAAEAIEGLVAGLHASDRPRVWSLVVTLFGDAILPRGGRAPLSLIQDVMGRLGIEAGAVRTAMSRLAADRWVLRERDGRNSFYRLAEEGRHAFDLATQRIYAPGPPEWDGRWTVAVLPPGSREPLRDKAMAAAGFVSPSPNCWLRPETAAAPASETLLDGALSLAGTALTLPAEPGSFWNLAEIDAAYGKLADEYARLACVLEGEPHIAGLDALAARLLVNHAWRRVALRDPGLPAALLPAGWKGESARAAVRRLYVALTPPSEAWLDAAGLPPVAEPRRFVNRFGGIQSSR